MNFEVETGSGSATATSYATIAQYASFWEDRGVTVTGTNAQKQGWLNVATEFIDIKFKFVGSPASSEQALEWPRIGTYDKFSQLIASDSIPDDIVKATCYLAYQQSQGDLFIQEDNVKSERYGPVAVTYSKSSASKSYPFVDRILRYYVSSGTQLQRVN